MNGFTVNIADFRCRGGGRATAIPHRPTRARHGIVNPQGDVDAPEESTVCDIEVEAQRLQRRNTLEPINIEHKAKVLRFRNVTTVQMIPNQMGLRVEQARGAERWSAGSNGPYDPPPAA